MNRFRQITVYLAIVLFCALSAKADFPEDIRLEKASYSKVTFSWLPPGATSAGISHYVIYRDGTELDETNELFYTDETVQPGTRYVYSVLAVMQGGQESDFSSELPVQTLTPSYMENSQLIEEIVDGFHDEPPSNLNAISLFSAVKAGFEALLGTNLFFSVVDENIVTAAMSEELDWINAVTPEPTEAERLEAQAEIDELLDSSFAGNSFDHTYINQQLTQLGDRHWNAGNRTAAELLYEFSLYYLSNHEPTVCQSLSRLAYFSRSHLTQDSSRSDISGSLETAKAYLDSFFDFFPSPDPTSKSAQMALAQPVGWYFTFFPKMLEYSNYDALFFATALEAAERLEAFAHGDANSERRLEKIAAWELLMLQLRFVDENGNPRTGRVRIRNVSAENGRGYLFPGEPWNDERDFVLSEGLATVPVYAGHDYSISLRVDVDGGNELQFELPVFRYGKNRAVSFDYLTGDFSEAPASQSRVDFVISSEAYPYNLRADRGIDVFDLSWDWGAPGDFETAGFKVYCGNREVVSVTGQTARLPLVSTSDEYGYRVVAFDTDGNTSVSSQILYVYPDDLEKYSDFFEWMDCYFGDRSVYASDDPDGDGVDNYHEFLNGTDPTRIPGPMLYAGPRGFNELTLEWESASDVPGAVYQISRNGCIVGTSASPRFTDTGLVPGVSYSYRGRVLEPTAAETDWGLPNTFRTQKAHGYEHADKVQQVVDRFLKFDIPGYTGPALLSAVRSAMETLTGSAISFTVIRPDLVEEMAEQELALLREACPVMTTAERIAARGELDSIMEECWGGNSFEEMYINAKLTELAENHWREYLADRTRISCRTAARELLEASLFFLNDHEPTVSATLARMARMELQALNADSTNAQIKNALNSSRDTHLRIYDYIPELADEHSNPYKTIINNYRKFFPRLLAYDTYDQTLFDSVLQLAAVYRDQNIADARRLTLYDEIAAWQLSMLTVTGGAANGTVTFVNVTPRHPSMPWGTDEGASRDSRTFQLNGTPLTVPVHSGHTYDVTLRIPVAGGEDWIHTVSGLKFGTGTMTTASPFAGITIEDMPSGNDSSVLAFPVGTVAFPYNLAYETFLDAFTLSWLYVPADGSTVDHYNVYRGNTLVATSTGMTCTGIPRTVCDDAVYTYSVAAVDAAGVESARSPIIEVLPDFTDEEQRYFEWKRLHFGNTAVLATDDSDGDGLANYQEFLLGSNPGLAPSGNPRESIEDILPGGTIRYYSGPFSSYPDFESLFPYKRETVRTIGQSSTEGEIFNSGSSGNIAVFISGYFDIAVPGIYRFNLNANGGAELTLDKAVLISFRNGGNNDRYADVYLETGTHLLELGFFRKGTQAALQLSWAGPDFSRTVFGSALWHTDEDDALLSETMSWQRDSDFDGIPDRIERSRGLDPFNPDTDGDGLTDRQELYVFFTNPTDADTDGDGMDDWEEAVLALSNPLAADFSGEPQVLQDLSGIDFSTSSEGWYSHGDSVECLSRNGYISYPIALASRGMYVLEVTGQNALASTAEALFSIDLEIAGTVCKSRDLISTDGGASTIRFYLPLLSAGTYNAKLIWNNIDQDKVLRINQVRLLALNGPDDNENSVPDWIDHRLVRLQQNNIPSISLTSPLCVEGGKGATLADIQVLSLAGVSRPYLDVEGHVVWTDGTDERVIDGDLTLAVPAVRDGVNGQFYANVELSPENVTEISIDRNGCETVQNVEWKETNVLYTPSMTIRRGDALLLSVRPMEDISGSAAVTIGRDRLTFASETAKIPYRFNYAGTFTVYAEFSSAGGTSVSGEMTVNVIEASFTGTPYSIAGIERNWQNARIPVEAELEGDAGIMIFRSDSASGADVSFCGNTPGHFNIVARLGDKGPVMAAGQLCILDSSTHKADGYYKIIDTFDDGTRLIEGKILLSEVPEDLNIRLAIYTTGTTFLDGTLVRTLTAADFDENGVCRYQMLKTDGSPTSTCHGISFYQGNGFLFSYQN